MQRQQFGEQKHWMIVTLAAMFGRMGRAPGGGFGLSYHFANGGDPRSEAFCGALFHAGQLAGWLRCR
ncbi:hypothetical protein ACLB1T_10345 [Escherichia coli]